jgi:hypothetical protein
LKKHVQQIPILKFGKTVICQINKTIDHYFSDFINQLAFLPDPRKSCEYGMDEIVMSSIAMFLFHKDSRNAFNNGRKASNFDENYSQLFGMQLPHMDTVDDVFRLMDNASLENIKSKMISQLIRNKVLVDQRYQGKYIVALDGTGIASYDEPCEGCITKTSKTGKVTYFHNVLEAKLLTASGLSLSMASEYIHNEGKANFVKQDCELKAFKRLAVTLKANFPRLPIIIVVDGLYPVQGFFDICKQNGWDYVVTLKDDSLKTLQEEIDWEKRIKPNQARTICLKKSNTAITQNYCWLSNLQYKEHHLNWVECIEYQNNTNTKKDFKQKFVHLTSLEMNNDTCSHISGLGRLRQKIENEGFNCQKNNGYNLEHKFSRTNFNAKKNYYQCLQIAHIINQLVIMSEPINNLLKADTKLTVKYLWERLISFLLECLLQADDLVQLADKPYQIRLS